MDLSPDFMRKLVAKRQEGESISIVESVEVEAGVGKHRSVLGEVFRVRVKVLLRSGKRKTFNLIVKNGEQGNSPEDFEITRAYYTTEIKAYKILERLHNLAVKERVKVDKVWADCLYSAVERNSYTIVLQDLSELGYHVFNGQLLDKEHAFLAVEGLAKVHALSTILIATEPVDMELMTINKISFLKDYFAKGLNVLSKAVYIWKEKWKYISKYLIRTSEDIAEEYDKLYNELRNEFTVLNLGDCWTNNMLFKYSETNLSPTSLKFIDFQFAHLNSFAWDLNYMVHVTLMPFLRLEIYDSLLVRYQEVFSTTIAEMDGDPSLAPTYPQVTSLMDKLLLPGLLFSSLAAAELHSATCEDYSEDAGTSSFMKLEWFLKDPVQNGYIKNIEYFESKGLFAT